MDEVTFTRFDAADYLKTEEDVTAYLDAVAEDGDPAAMALALGAVVRARRGMTRLARETGLTREGLHKALSPGGNPSFGTVAKVATAMGFPLAFRTAARASAGGAVGAKAGLQPDACAKTGAAHED